MSVHQCRAISARAAADGFEIRSFAEARIDRSDDRRLRGYAIVFNQRSVNLGGFVEIIVSSAVDRTLREALDVRALVDHDTSKVLGRTTSGTLELKKDRKGLMAAIDPPNTSYARDIVESVERGDVSGMSFRFRVMPDGQEWDVDEDGIYIRTITDMTMDEVSIVTFPAYEATTVDVAQRALAAFQLVHPAKRSWKFLERWHRTQLAR